MDDVKKLFEYVGIEVVECEPEGIVLKFPNGHEMTIHSIYEYLNIVIEKPEIDFDEFGEKYSVDEF